MSHLTIPTDPGYFEISVFPRRIVGKSESPASFVTHFQEFSGQRFEWSVTLPALKRADAQEWTAFFDQANLLSNTFNLGPEPETSPLGTGGSGGNQRVSNASGATLTGSSVSTIDWGANLEKVMKKGDFFQIHSGASAEIKRMAADATTDGSGDVLLTFFPKLRTAAVAFETITITSPVGAFRLAQQVQYNVNTDRLWEFPFAIVEAF